MGGWEEYECGMADFLILAIEATEEEAPVAIFSTGSPRFLHWRVEQDIRATGADPWPELAI
jgi:hypothetical protein